MDQIPPPPFRLGDWIVHPQDGTLRSGDECRRVEPQVMDVLVFLAARSGEVVTKRQLLDHVWKGSVVTEDVLAGSVYQLRKALGDDARTSRYIETIPKRGYRLRLPAESRIGAEAATSPRPRVGRRARLVTLAVVALAGVGLWVFGSGRRTPSVSSLAVLPLKNLSPDPSDAYVAEGVTVALTTELAKLAALRVISHTSVTSYRDSGKRASEIAGELHVDAIVEGSVTRSGGRVRVDAQLIDARRDAHLWADSYEGEVGDLLQLQSDIAQSVARSIQLRLETASGGRPSAGPLPSGAMEAYLKGRTLLDQPDPGALMQARVYFQRAAELAPAFAEAHAGLAAATALLVYRGLGPVVELSREARAAALRALELNPDLAEAHAAQGMILTLADWNFPEAEREIRRAVQLQPGFARARGFYAYLLSIQARHDEAVRESREALALDPLHLPSHLSLGEALLMARRYDEVVQQMKKALELDPALPATHMNMAMARWLQGREPEAYASYRTALQSQGFSGEALEAMDRLFSAQGMRGVFKSGADYLRRQPVRTQDIQVGLVVAYAAAGDRERALEVLAQAYEQRHPKILTISVSPFLDVLRTDRRFSDLVSRLGLPERPNPRVPGQPQP